MRVITHTGYTHRKGCVHSIHVYINTHRNLSADYHDIGSGETRAGLYYIVAFEMPTLKHNGASSHIHFTAKYMCTYLTINLTFIVTLFRKEWPRRNDSFPQEMCVLFICLCCYLCS